MGLLTRSELIASYYTINGAPGPAVQNPSRFSFEERIVALANAGFTGMGMTPEQPGPLSNKDKHDIAARHGLNLPEIEFLTGWYLDGAEGEESLALEAQLFEMVDAFGTRQLNAAMAAPPGELPPFDFLGKRFGEMCDRAAEHNLVVALEALAPRGLNSPMKALEIVKAANRPNGGILIDFFHFFRGPSNFDELRTIPAELIFGVQMNDADAVCSMDLMLENRHHRRLPGEGGCDVVGLLVTLDEMGVDAPLAVEMMNDELRALPVEEAAVRVATAARAVIAEAQSRRKEKSA